MFLLYKHLHTIIAPLSGGGFILSVKRNTSSLDTDHWRSRKMLNPIMIKIAIIFLFIPDYLLAAAHLIYFQKLRLDLIKRRCTMLLCAVGFFFFIAGNDFMSHSFASPIRQENQQKDRYSLMGPSTGSSEVAGLTPPAPE